MTHSSCEGGFDYVWDAVEAYDGGYVADEEVEGGGEEGGDLGGGAGAEGGVAGGRPLDLGFNCLEQEQQQESGVRRR